jgi:uncharacterized protein YycO
MKVLQYRGRGLISRSIRFQTRSVYSHSALAFSDGDIIEAWHTEGVRWITDPFDRHDLNTLIDVYGIHGVVDDYMARVFAEAQIGKKYDFWTVGRFLTRRTAPRNDRWFCSELVLTILKEGGLELLHGNYSEMSPRDVAISPLLTYEKTIGTT